MPASGPPYLYWTNRDDPYLVQSVSIASSGKVAIVRNPVSGDKGKYMKVVFRMATAANLSTWAGYTGTFTILGKTVIWAPGNAFQYQHEIFPESDTSTTDYIDYYRGTMNLLIVV